MSYFGPQMSAHRLVRCGSGGLVAVTVAVLVTVASISRVASAGVALDDCLPSQVKLSAVPVQNAFTGGAYPLSIVLRNVSKHECGVEGHPQVVVEPKPFPVVVGDVADFDRHDPLIGPERFLRLLPGHTVSAQVIVGRPCDGARSDMTTTTIAFAAYQQQVSAEVSTCRREGVVLYAGPFIATH